MDGGRVAAAGVFSLRTRYRALFSFCFRTALADAADVWPISICQTHSVVHTIFNIISIIRV